MQSAKANTLLQSIIDDVNKNGMNADSFIPKLQEAREFALKEEDPLVTRALRLVWQHLESNGSFGIELAEDIESEDENFAYFLSLCVKSDNTYNRDELREMTNALQALA
ncbi:MAG: hypothetical protein ACO3DK_08255 [Bacteroidia bacterium]|jgi:hypothetical protein